MCFFLFLDLFGLAPFGELPTFPPRKISTRPLTLHPKISREVISSVILHPTVVYRRVCRILTSAGTRSSASRESDFKTVNLITVAAVGKRRWDIVPRHSEG